MVTGCPFFEVFFIFFEEFLEEFVNGVELVDDGCGV
jgi:hypothetical protein